MGVPQSFWRGGFFCFFVSFVSFVVQLAFVLEGRKESQERWRSRRIASEWRVTLVA
jgi:hypothetical protein